MSVDSQESILYNKQCLTEIVQSAVAQALETVLSRTKHLDNCIVNDAVLPEKESNHMSRIKKHIRIGSELKWITADSEQEYAEKVAMAFAQSGLLSSRTSKPVTAHPFRDYAQNWLDVYEKPHIAEVTAIGYQRILNKHIFPAIGGKTVETVTTDDIQSLYNGLKSKSLETIAKVRNVLGMVMRRALDEDIIQRNPMDSDSLRVSGGKTKKTPAYPVEDMKYFVNHINDIESPRDKAWFALMLFHPLRLEECLGLKHADITRNDGAATMRISATVTHPTRNEPVFAEKTKTDKSRRTLEISPTALQYIYEGPPDTFVVYGSTPADPMSYTSLRRMCDRIARQIGYGGQITPRRFRTTVASDLYAATKDVKLVQDALGHSRFSQIALDHYIECRQSVGNTGRIIDSVYT